MPPENLQVDQYAMYKVYNSEIVEKLSPYPRKRQSDIFVLCYCVMVQGSWLDPENITFI